MDCSGESMALKSTEVLWRDPDSGAAVEISCVEQDRGVSWELAKQRYDDAIAAGAATLTLLSC